MSEATTLEGRLRAAGFTQSLGWWKPPGDERLMDLAGAIGFLESDEYTAGARRFEASMDSPDTGVRAFPDELVDRMFNREPELPPWLEPLAELVAEKLKPTIRAELRKWADK
jgi:hypothetical protein